MLCTVQAQAAGGKYSVLVEQRGLAGALLLESQVPPQHSSCKLFCNLQPLISYAFPRYGAGNPGAGGGGEQGPGGGGQAL